MTGLVVVVTGLQFEARIAAGAGVQVLCHQNAALAAHLEAALTQDCRGIASFGIAGGLVDTLRPGEWVVARTLTDGTRQIDCDALWSESLLQALPTAHHVNMVGTRTPAVTPDAKRTLHTATGAAAVDMESQIVARIAQARSIPFVCCRVIADPVERTLPAAALAGVRSDGSTDTLAVLGSIVTSPGQLPALMQVARDAWIARRALTRGRRNIGAGFGLMPGA